MPRHLRSKPHVWRIDRLTGEVTEYLGVIVAPDSEAAIKEACKKFGVTEPERVRLVVRELPRGRAVPVQGG